MWLELKSSVHAVVFMALCALFAGWSHAARATHVLQLFTEHFPPFSYEDDGEITGSNTEILRTLCQRAGVECSFTIYPWRRAFENALSNSHSGLFSTSRSSDREHLFQWVGPLAYNQPYLYRLRRRPEIQVEQLNDAKKYMIAVARGMYLRNTF